MIDILGEDLAARVRTVPALTGSAAFALGGHAADPGLKDIALPAAWIGLIGEQVEEAPFSPATPAGGIVSYMQVMLSTFSVIVIVDYSQEASLLGTQFPLMIDVMKAVHGQQSPSGHRWRYFGSKLAFTLPDRIGYDQRYTVTWALNPDL
jgi:hypothetical protein